MRVVPIKVPLGRRFDSVLSDNERFSPQLIIEHLEGRGIKVGLVLDLTNTWRYYDPNEWLDRGIDHRKIQCRGRNEMPEPEAVNSFVWTLMTYLRAEPDKHVIVHCTHGYNRTGYMLVNYMVRHGLSVTEALQLFAKHRPPGIYKADYMDTLFKYNHELPPVNHSTPATPDWKPAEADADDDEPAAFASGNGPPKAAEGEPPEMRHDDLLGEEVLLEEADNVQGLLPEEVGRLFFPGSQPVSLARSNIGLLDERRYWVTWKADGTRYMLLLCHWGVYIIDRSFQIRRVQMRFPGRSAKGKPRGVHHMTLLDGELVVDTDVTTGKLTRRFLAYDLMTLNTHSVTKRAFKERFAMLEKEVMEPRRAERIEMERARASASAASGLRYEYGSELFSVRRKDFWPLFRARTLLEKFIPALCHETDGLIFQGYEDHYKPGTCEELLKWKFAHLNSVDFMFRSTAAGPELYLLETRKNRPRGLALLQGAVVTFPGDEDPRHLEGRIVECTWDAEAGAWVFLRERTDKNTPNAYHVYEKVMQSIDDNITEDDLLAAADKAVTLPPYERDMQQAAARGQVTAGV
ncbi:hypothetical protein WJX81_004542 [Elliptochloris bilobata]|uniref:mRNA guanylyltransferase n=1 Tax=Elliptochloris bilobata TaxID=381761 RepID=A0AAW1SA15_9CHLO